MLEILEQLRGGGESVVYKLKQFYSFQIIIKTSSCVINQSYSIWTVRLKIISHT
jgi:hypothetical protein